MTILRVFLVRTALTPDDPLVRIGYPLRLADTEHYDEIHVSVLYTWHAKRPSPDEPSYAEKVAAAWSEFGPVKIGGPGMGERGEDHEPGLYTKRGAVITSRGCPNRCWFCRVPQREGHAVRELPIREGWNVLDDNLLRASPEHIDRVFEMLSRQRHRPAFTGGLEAAALTPEIARRLVALKPGALYFAYDTPDDLAPLRTAADMLRDAGAAAMFQAHHIGCYVLCGYEGDTHEAAEARFVEAARAGSPCPELHGMLPYPMVYRGDDGVRDPEWVGRRWVHKFMRPASAVQTLKAMGVWADSAVQEPDSPCDQCDPGVECETCPEDWRR